MPPKHSLLYFNGAGRAEAIRILLSAAGADWEDVRIPFAEWKDRKGRTPLGSMPVLTIDQVPHVQSVALARYAARLAGWYPSDDPLQALLVDEVMETLNELASTMPRSGDPQELYKLRSAWQDKELTTVANFLESRIQANGGSGFTTSSPTVADLMLRNTVHGVQKGFMDHIEMNFFDKFPGIMATVQMVEEQDAVKAYYASKE